MSPTSTDCNGETSIDLGEAAAPNEQNDLQQDSRGETKAESSGSKRHHSDDTTNTCSGTASKNPRLVNNKRTDRGRLVHDPQEPMTLVMVAKETAIATRRYSSSSCSSHASHERQSSPGTSIGVLCGRRFPRRNSNHVTEALTFASAAQAITDALEPTSASSIVGVSNEEDLGYGQDDGLGYGQDDLGYGDANTNRAEVAAETSSQPRRRFQFHRRNSFVVPETSRSGGGGPNRLRRHVSFPWASVVYNAANEQLD